MPRRKSATTITQTLGKRISLLRNQGERANVPAPARISAISRGHLSNIERGLVDPTVTTLRKIADDLGLDLPYLVTFPGESARQALIERTRFMSTAEVDELLKKLGPVPHRMRTRRRAPLRLGVWRPRRAV